MSGVRKVRENMESPCSGGGVRWLRIFETYGIIHRESMEIDIVEVHDDITR